MADKKMELIVDVNVVGAGAAIAAEKEREHA